MWCELSDGGLTCVSREENLFTVLLVPLSFFLSPSLALTFSLSIFHLLRSFSTPILTRFNSVNRGKFALRVFTRRKTSFSSRMFVFARYDDRMPPRRDAFVTFTI